MDTEARRWLATSVLVPLLVAFFSAAGGVWTAQRTSIENMELKRSELAQAQTFKALELIEKIDQGAAAQWAREVLAQHGVRPTPANEAPQCLTLIAAKIRGPIPFPDEDIKVGADAKSLLVKIAEGYRDNALRFRETLALIEQSCGVEMTPAPSP